MIADPQTLKQGLAAKARAFTGDYALSDLEEQGFLAARQPPLFDRVPVEDATVDDLDTELVDAFLAAVRERDPAGLGRFTDDAELLRRAGVILTGGQPTVAGLLALGVHPQQWFPRYVIQAAAQPLAGDSLQTRARNQVTITGSIPRMLDAALLWARRTFDTSIVSEPDGTVHDRPAYPFVAVCQHVRSSETGARVIEALASGIPTVTEALTEQGLPPAHYVDSGIRFTVVLHQPSTTPTATEPDLTATERRIYQALDTQAWTVADLVEKLDLTAPNIRKTLRNLRSRGLVTHHLPADKPVVHAGHRLSVGQLYGNRLSAQPRQRKQDDHPTP